MTIDELWQNIQPILLGLREDVSDLKLRTQNLEKDMKEVKKDVSDLKLRMQNLEKDVSDLKLRTQNLGKDVSDLKLKTQNLQKDMKEVKGNIYAIKEVNLANILKYQVEMKTEIVEMIQQYMKQNEIEHKKFDYKISNLEWHTKIAN